MSDFPIHDETSAPTEARETLKAAKAKLGFLPNLLGELSESPAAVEAYTTLSGIFDKTDLTAPQRQVVLLAVSVANECGYCVAAHTRAAQGAGLDEDSIKALRAGRDPSDAKLSALANFARSLVSKSGWADDGDVEAFLEAGFTKANVFDVILGVSFKTISNYANHVAETPIDDAFEAAKWDKAA
jgi:uncharacterized peroxidase-related enzyme